MRERKKLKARHDLNRNNFSIHIWVLALSAVFLIFGNRIATDGEAIINRGVVSTIYSATVIEIIERAEHQREWATDTFITFYARVRGSPSNDTNITAVQTLSTGWLSAVNEVEAGDRVLLFYDRFNERFHFHDYLRINYVVMLGVAFLILIVLFGKKKGLNSIIALGFTCMAIFHVFVPAILAGRNIYITTVIICVFVIVSTMLTVIGLNKKSLSAMLGCMGGVLLAGLMMFFMDGVLNLTGIIDSDTEHLRMLSTGQTININAIIFASVTIGAVGAIMDVAMSIASSLWEIRLASIKSNFHSIFTSGINIGKDILGTMLNTLILAYIGSSLSTILLIVAYTTSYIELFNREMVIVELLRALTGSFGMFLSIPLTAAICACFYVKKRNSQR